MPAHRFEARIESTGTGASVEVPLDVPAVFGRVRAPVVATVNGHSWRTTLMRYGGIDYLGIARANRDAAGVDVGETVTVTLEADDAPRTVDMPDDLVAALDAAGARAGFDGHAFSHRREWVEWVTAAKRPETRQRRIGGVVEQILARPG